MGGLMTIAGLTFDHGSKFASGGHPRSRWRRRSAPPGSRSPRWLRDRFGTDWAGRSMVRAASQIDDYQPIFAPLRTARQAVSGNQPGDPAKAAQVMLDLVDMDNPPVHPPARLRRREARHRGSRRGRRPARRVGAAEPDTDFADDARIASA